MKLLRLLLSASRGTVALAVVAGLVGGVGSVGLIALTRRELARDDGPSPTAALAFAALCLLAAAARTTSQVALVRLGQGTIARLALRLARRVLALPLERFERLDAGALTAALTEDIGIVANALVGLPLVCINLPVVIACLVYGGWLSPAVLASGLAFAAPAVLGYVMLERRGLRHLRAGRAAHGDLVGHVRGLIAGFRELKQHRDRRSAFVAEALEPTAAAARDRTAAGLAAFALAGGWSQLLMFGFIGILLFVLPGLADLDRPTLVGAVLVVLFLMPSLNALLNWLPMLGRGRASLEKIEALLPEVNAGEPDGTAVPVPALFQRSIGLVGASYAYQSDGEAGFVLGPIDLTIRPGELVVLAGGNGSGKTTLVKLLAGLYRPTGGAVLLDGRAVAAEESEAYRQLFTVVFADGHLFRALLGLDLDGRGREAEAGLRRLGLDGRVRIEDGAFSTIDLSVGQRRRLSLLTALLEDRPLCVFDEWAANQDPESRRAFYAEVLPELRALGKALIVVSHDEESFHVADRVLRLRDGAVVAAGPVVAGRDDGA